MCSLVFPNSDSMMPGVLKMASGNVTIITRSPKNKKVTSVSKGANKRKLDSDFNDENENVDSSMTSKVSKKKSKLTGTARRNERERNRVKQVNQGFVKLRDHVPKRGRGRKMSKVDILRSAAEYIQNLQGMLDESDAVSAVLNIAALSASLGENGQLLDDASDSLSCSGSITGSSASSTSSSSQDCGFPLSPSSYDAAPSPGCCSVEDGSSSTSSASEHHMNPYSPEEPTLLDLATWFH